MTTVRVPNLSIVDLIYTDSNFKQKYLQDKPNDICNSHSTYEAECIFFPIYLHGNIELQLTCNMHNRKMDEIKSKA